MAALIAVVLALIYRYAPSRDEPKWRWISWGSVFAAVGWLVFSAAFSFYAANFGTFNKTYGSLGAVIGFMLWIWLSVTVILLGGKLNAEIEHQTERDTTEGEPEPLGKRGAHVADTVGSDVRLKRHGRVRAARKSEIAAHSAWQQCRHVAMPHRIERLHRNAAIIDAHIAQRRGAADASRR